MPEVALSRRGIANTLRHLGRSRWRESRIHTSCFCSTTCLLRAELKQLYLLSFKQSHPPYSQHIILTYLLTPWCRVLLEKLTGLQLVKKFPAFHGTRKFITALTSVRRLSIPDQPHPVHIPTFRLLDIHPNIIHRLPLGLPSGLLPSGFTTKTLYTPLSSPIRATCPAHLILLDFITRTILGEEYKSFSSSL